MSASPTGIVWMLDLTDHSSLGNTTDEKARILDFVGDFIQDQAAALNPKAFQALEGDKLLLCFGVPMQTVVEGIVELARSIHLEYRPIFARRLREKFGWDGKDVGFNQFVFEGDFVLRQEGQICSDEVDYVSKHIEKRVTNRPNVSVSRTVIEQLSEATQQKFTNTVAKNPSSVEGMAFLALEPASSPASAKLDGGLRFGVLPAIKSFPVDQDAIDEVMANLGHYSLCNITGPPGTGKTSLALKLFEDQNQDGAVCLWFNSWSLLTFEYLTHVIANTLSRLGTSPSYVVDSLRFVENDSGWPNRYEILLGALRECAHRIFFVLDDFNHGLIDDHVRDFFRFVGRRLVDEPERDGRLQLLFVTTSGPLKGFNGLPDLLDQQRHQKCQGQIDPEALAARLACEYNTVSKMTISELGETYGKNIRVHKLLCALCASETQSADTLGESLRHTLKLHGRAKDEAVIRSLFEGLDDSVKDVVRTARQLSPLLSPELYAYVGDGPENDLKAAIDQAHELGWLEEYDCSSAGANRPNRNVYRLPRDLESVIKPEPPCPVLLAKAARFFEDQLDSGLLSKAKDSLPFYRAYRYAAHFYRAGACYLELFRLANRWKSRLIDNGIVAELARDVKECQLAVTNSGGSEMQLDFYMLRNQLWRILFRWNRYKKNLDEMEKLCERLENEGDANATSAQLAFRLETGIYLTLRRDYEGALRMLQYDDLRTASRLQPEHKASLEKLDLRVIQTLMSLGRLNDVREKLSAFGDEEPYLNQLKAWLDQAFKEPAAVMKTIAAFAACKVPKGGSLDGDLGHLCSEIDRDEPERGRALCHSFAMWLRFVATFHLLNRNRHEALRTGLACLVFNHCAESVSDQTGVALSLMRLARILSTLDGSEDALELSDKLTNKSLKILELKTQSQWWLACAHHTKARIATRREDWAAAESHIKQMRTINHVNSDDEWRNREADILDFFVAMGKGETERVSQLEKIVFPSNLGKTNPYLDIETYFELGGYLAKAGEYDRAKSTIDMGASIFARVRANDSGNRLLRHKLP